MDWYCLYSFQLKTNWKWFTTLTSLCNWVTFSSIEISVVELPTFLQSYGVSSIIIRDFESTFPMSFVRTWNWQVRGRFDEESGFQSQSLGSKQSRLQARKSRISSILAELLHHGRNADFKPKRPILSLEPDLDLDWGCLQNNRGTRLQDNRGKRLKNSQFATGGRVRCKSLTDPPEGLSWFITEGKDNLQRVGY